MLNQLKLRLPAQEFNRNVLTLLTGTGIAQLIPFLLTPALSRLYTPEQFGLFALFLAVASSVSTAATGRYELAIMIPRNETAAAQVHAVSLLLNLGFCLALLLIVMLAPLALPGGLYWPGARALAGWLYAVPLAVLLNGLNLSLSYWCNRQKLFALMARRKIVQSAATAGLQLACGLLGAAAAGLMLASLAGQLLAAALMASLVWRRSARWRCRLRWRRLWAAAGRYRNFPFYLVPAHTLSAVSSQFPVLFINAVFGLGSSGLYMLAERVLGAPLSLIAASVADVFRQQISQARLERGDCREEFILTLKKLLLVATPPFLLLALCSPWLFVLLFGPQWRLAGDYAQLMCPMFFLRFVCNPLSVVAIIVQKNRSELLWQGALLAALALAAWANSWLALGVKGLIVLFTAIYCVLDLVYLWINYRYACQRRAAN